MKIVVIGGPGLIGSRVVRLPNSGCLRAKRAQEQAIKDLRHSLHDRPLDPALRVPWRHRAIVGRWPDHSSFTSKNVTDVHARYFGAELKDKSLAPGDTAPIGSTSFETWLGQA